MVQALKPRQVSRLHQGVSVSSRTLVKTLHPAAQRRRGNRRLNAPARWGATFAALLRRGSSTRIDIHLCFRGTKRSHCRLVCNPFHNLRSKEFPSRLRNLRIDVERTEKILSAGLLSQFDTDKFFDIRTMGVVVI